jgi:hypothetical protein
MSKHYILENREIKEVDLMTWAKWFETSKDKQIAKSDSSKGWKVSTVFLGLDHSFGVGEPLLFETMVFNSNTELDGEPFRYSTLGQAEKGHEEIVAKVKDLLPTNNKEE